MAVNDATNNQTPMIRQYLRIKSQHPEAILFFRMGDFYEMFFDDAKTASRILNITLTSRDRDKSDAVPLCGVPFHSAENYVTRLVKEGYKVAICEQVGEADAGNKLVRREVIRVITPGTIMAEGYLSDKQNNFLGAVNVIDDRTGLAFLDIGTGDFVALDLPSSNGDELANHLADFEPAELIVPDGIGGKSLVGFKIGAPSAPVVKMDAAFFTMDKASAVLRDHFSAYSLEALGLEKETAALIGAAGAVLKYALDTQKATLDNVRRLTVLRPESFLRMDASTQRNLELVRSSLDGGRRGTLLDILDDTLTPMGGRLLRQWILRPLTDIPTIEKRLDAVAVLVADNALNDDLRAQLRKVHDLDRLLARFSLGMAGPRDLLSLAASVEALPEIKALASVSGAALLANLASQLDSLAEPASRIRAVIKEDAPAVTREGGFVKQGGDAVFDHWLEFKVQGRSKITAMEARERGRTGIASLKIKYTKVFGYFIEVTKANLKDIPGDYLRKQTLVGAERFTTPELTECETKLLEADQRCLEREQEIFKLLQEMIVSHGELIRRASQTVAEIDAIGSLARVARRRNYNRPKMSMDAAIAIREGRHPVVEALNPGEPFIPNDCTVDGEENQILIITGPNMAGKSTFLRQTALIVLLAHMGSFVPAAEAAIGVTDRIFTRVGATDYLARGQSTFMVEMIETAAILRQATPRSLVILDEIGRGTGTFDGLAIAWAVAEYLHDTPGAKARTLFATHYHQLTELALTLPGVKNFSSAVKEWGDRIVFLRRIIPGGTDKSYGIQVARLAGLPRPVIDRAKEIMANLEAGELNTAGQPRLADHRLEVSTQPNQLYLFTTPERDVIEQLRAQDINQLTPLQALAFLDALITKLTSGGGAS